MAFKIVNEKGKVITKKQLNKEAARFWKRPINRTRYAKPQNGLYVTNWFDRIGWDISESKAKTWN